MKEQYKQFDRAYTDKKYEDSLTAFRDRILNEELGNKLLVTIFVGTNNTPENRVTILNTFISTLIDMFGGFTKVKTYGGYKSDTMRLYEESNVYTVIVNPQDYHFIVSQVDKLKIDLKQESILVTRQFVNAEFI